MLFRSTHVGGNKWNYVVNTALASNGFHDVYLKVYFTNGDVWLSDQYNVEILNDETEVILIEDPENYDYLLDPDIQIEVAGGNLVVGTTEVTVLVAEAESVELYAIPAYGGVPHYIGTAEQTYAD